MEINLVFTSYIKIPEKIMILFNFKFIMIIKKKIKHLEAKKRQKHINVIGADVKVKIKNEILKAFTTRFDGNISEVS